MGLMNFLKGIGSLVHNNRNITCDDYILSGIKIISNKKELYNKEELLERAEYERYTDSSKLITDINELRIENRNEVLIYRGDKYFGSVVVDIEDCSEGCEELKPLIIFIAQNLHKMDYMAEECYNQLRQIYSPKRQRKFHIRSDRYEEGEFIDEIELAYVYITSDEPDIIDLIYWGIKVNTEVCVEFQHKDGEIILKKYGRFIIDKEQSIVRL